MPLGSTLIALANPILKALVAFFAQKEGLDTVTESERSLFTKLSLALVFNTVVIPILVAFWQSAKLNGELGIDQAWYEEGGVVDGFISLCNRHQRTRTSRSNLRSSRAARRSTPPPPPPRPPIFRRPEAPSWCVAIARLHLDRNRPSPEPEPEL